jgi:hypothetical protein
MTMNPMPFRRATALCALLASTALAACGLTAAPAAAQTSVYDLPEKLVDANGVDLPAGKLLIRFPVIEFGEGIRLKADYFARYPEPGAYNGVPAATFALDFIIRPSIPSGTEEIETGWTPFGSYAFYRLATWETVMPDGRAYSKPAGGRFLTQLQSASWQTPGHHSLGMIDEQGDLWESSTQTPTAIVNRALFADGEIWTIKYEKSPYANRLRNVGSNRGFIIQYQYELETAPTAQSQAASWTRIVKISGGSLAYNYCDTSGVALCAAISAAGNSATLTHFANGYEITHASGFKKRIEAPGVLQLLVSSPGTNEQVKAAFGYTACDQSGSIGEITRNGQTWQYAYEECTEEERGISWLLTRTDPLGKTIRVRQLSSYSIPDTYTDELGREFSFSGGPEVGYAGFSYPEINGAGRSHNSRNKRHRHLCLREEWRDIIDRRELRHGLRQPHHLQPAQCDHGREG